MLFDFAEPATTKTLIQVSFLAILLVLECLWPQFKFGRGQITHGLKNIGFGLFNALMVAVLFGAVMAYVVDREAAVNLGLLQVWSLPVWLRIVAVIVLFDLWMYLWHRANHRFHLLWRFHRMHHTDRTLNATSAFRFHTGEIFLSSLLRLGVLPLLGMSLTELLLYETLLQPVILFHHSNVRFPERIDRILRAVIVTPHMHWIHHSMITTEYNSNYASIFSWWDRIGRSFRHRRDIEFIEYGLQRFEDTHWQTIGGMLKTPLT